MENERTGEYQIRKIDITGQKYGRLTAIKSDGKSKSGKTLWLCKCDCGNYTHVPIDNLKSGNTKSCGCLQKENGVNRGRDSKKHGMTHTPIYEAWRRIKDRCYNHKKDGYNRYGGRGIQVCDEWLGDNGFNNFYHWAIQNGYSEDLEIDRIDNDGNYCPENCRWVTKKVNMRNRSVNRWIETPWGKMTVADFAERINGDYDLVYAQVSKGLHDIEWIAEKYKDTNDYVGKPYKHRI